MRGINFNKDPHKFFYALFFFLLIFMRTCSGKPEQNEKYGIILKANEEYKH